LRTKVFFALMLVLCVSAVASAESTTCQQLIVDAAAWNGKTVSITGEVVGDILKTDGFVWLNVNDGTNAIGVWTDVRSLTGIEIVPGNYKVKGTIIEVEGVFSRTCSLHSGETDIHLVRFNVVSDHVDVSHPVKLNRLVFAALLLALAGILTLAVSSKMKGARRPIKPID
jgi:hypothetical protein